MDRISAARARLESASTPPGLLDTAYDAFEAILAVLRHHQEHVGGAFPSFVISAAAAGNGRDDIGDAPSLPPATMPASPAAPAGRIAGSSIRPATSPATPADLTACAGITEIAPARPVTPDGLLAGASVTEVALAIAGLSQVLAARLNEAAGSAPGPADQASCRHAARQAARISGLLAWACQP